MKLQGKTTLITGASGGIGSAIAKQFAREGLNLVLCGRSTEKLAAIRTTCENLGAQVLTISGDVTADSFPAEAMAAVQDRFGGLDILVNNAGMALSCPLEETSHAQFDRIMALNVRTPYFMCQAALPLLRQYKQLHYVEVQEHAIRQSFARIGHTLRHLKEDRQVFWFLLAFFCYIDGVYTIIDMATAYGTALGLDTTGLLLALLVTQIVAFPSALIFGRLSQKYESKTLIPVCIAAYTGIAVFAFFLKSQWQFWVLAVVVGMFQGGVQALSRSHFAKIIPQEKSGEYFGLFDICGKGASFLGTMIVSVGSQLTGSANVGVGSIAILFVIGFVLFSISTRTEETKRV